MDHDESIHPLFDRDGVICEHEVFLDIQDRDSSEKTEQKRVDVSIGRVVGYDTEDEDIQNEDRDTVDF